MTASRHKTQRASKRHCGGSLLATERSGRSTSYGNRTTHSLRVRYWLPFFLLLAFNPSCSWAGAQVYTPLSASVRAVLQQSVSDEAAPRTAFSTQYEADVWMNEMSRRIEKRLPDKKYRMDFLSTVHYEATRAGLDPQLVLGLIEVESGFKKYAVSSAGARGYMQVMPFWVKEIGTKEQDLFHLRTNLRYGCTILRHYIDIENGNLYRALGRYNGSLGRPEYPNMVRAAWQGHWMLQRRTVSNSYPPAS